jgi:group I intron endonuclease
MSQNKICGVYKITHIGSGKSYIGISKNIHRRWIQHKSWVNTKNRRSAIYAAMQKYGIDAFSWQVIEQCDADSLEIREQHWIAVFDTFRNGYNLTAGGEYNKEFSADTRKRMSEAQKGKKQSQETIDKRTARGANHWTYGKPRSEETKEKIRKSLSGRKQNPAVTAKISKSNTGKKMSPEAVEKSRIARTGMKFTEQAKKNLSEAHKGIKPSEETKRKMSESRKKYLALKKLDSMQASATIQ